MQKHGFCLLFVLICGYFLSVFDSTNLKTFQNTMEAPKLLAKAYKTV